MVAKPQEPKVEAPAVQHQHGDVTWSSHAPQGLARRRAEARFLHQRGPSFAVHVPDCWSTLKELSRSLVSLLIAHPEDLEIATQTARSRHLKTIRDIKL